MKLEIKMTGLSGALLVIWFFSMWIFGAVLAKGFWSTFMSIFFFPWGFYLVVEKLALHFGLL